MNKPKVGCNLHLPTSYDDLYFGASTGVGILPSVNSGFRTCHPTFRRDLCIHCNLCWIYCPEGCIDRTSGQMEVDMDYCKGCGICAHECPKKCITMVRDGEDDG